MKIKILMLTKSEQGELMLGFRTGASQCFRMCCRAVLLKSEGLSLAYVGEQTEMIAQSVNGWVKRFETEGIKGLHTCAGQERTHYGLFGRRCSAQNHRVRLAKCPFCKGSMAEIICKEASDLTFRRFFRIGARYRRIRKRPRSVPSLQLYQYKTGKLQELEQLYAKGEINLFYGDESHVCTARPLRVAVPR